MLDSPQSQLVRFPASAEAGAGFLSKAGSAFAAAQPWLAAAQFAFSIVARSKARSKAKSDARDSTAVRIKDVQPVEANASAPLLYGTCATRGRRVFVAVNSGATIPLDPAGPKVGAIPFDRSQRNAGGISCNPKEFLFAQYVLSVGRAGPLLDLAVDGRGVAKRWDDNGLSGPYGGTLAGAWQPAHGAASAFASAFSPLRDASATFAGLTVADFWAQMPDSSEGKYRVFRARLPEPVFFTRGRWVREMAAGAPTATVHLTDNAACVLMDYLTSADALGLPDSAIDMAAMQTFRDQCERSLIDEAASPGSVTDQMAADVRPYLGAADRALYDAGTAQARRAVALRFYEAQGYAGAGVVPGATRTLRRALGRVRWGSYNGEVDSALAFQDAVEQIIQGVPGCVVAETSGDRLKASAPDWRGTAAAQRVATLTDDELTAPVRVVDPDDAGRYNKVAATFNDIDKDFHSNTESWTDADLVAADGGETLETEERVAGLATAVQARTLARSRALVSRRRVFSGTYNIRALGKSRNKGLAVIEVNDCFRLHSALQGIDEDLLMQEYDIDADTGQCEFTAIEYEPLDYGPVLAARHTEAATIDEPLSTGAFVRLAGVPEHAVPAGTTLRIRASVVGTTKAAAWTFAGTGVANANGATTDWTPTAAGNTLTATATIGACVLTAVAEVSVETAAAPTVEVVAQGERRYGAVANGFGGAATLEWEISPPAAAGRLDSTSSANVRIAGGDPSLAGQLRVRAKRGAKTADDAILLPHSGISPDHGGANAVDGEERIPAAPTFDDETRSVTATVPDRAGRHCQFRWRRKGETQWRALPDNRDATETWLVGPDAKSIEVQARLVYGDGSFARWATFCADVAIPGIGAPPIYGAVAADGCPPAERGVVGQLWIAPDGRVWRRGPDVWSDTADALARLEFDLAYHDYGGGERLFAPNSYGGNPPAKVAAARRLPAALGGLYIAALNFRVAGLSRGRWQLDLASAVPWVTESTGADLPDGVAEDLVVALRHGAKTTWTRVGTADDADPYFWVDAAERQFNFFTGTRTLSDVEVLFLRASERCASDPLNPWTPEEPLGVVGLDGRGVEWIHSLASSDAAIPAGEIPPNTLPYDSARNAQGVDQGVRIVGGAVSQASSGGRVWFDEERQTSAANPFDVAMFRAVPGQPARGAVPGDTWGDWQGPVFRRLWGADGTDGEDGAGWERVFALTATKDAPSASPSNSAAYDSYPAVPASPRANTVYDGLPSVTADLPFGWVAERSVPGTPAKDAAHDDSWGDWSDWELREHYGQDGEDGEDGSDGAGKEWCFAVTSTSDEPTVEPSDTARYDSFPTVPRTPRANTIYDDYPAVSADHPWGWVNVRRVPGTPAKHAAHDDSWGDWGGWKLHEHYGQDGDAGEDSVQISQAALADTIPLDGDDHYSGTLSSTQVEWSKGGQRIERLTLTLYSRNSNGKAQARLRISSIDYRDADARSYLTELQVPSGPALSSSRRRRTTLNTSSTHDTGWADAPRQWTLECAGVTLPIRVDVAPKPPAPVAVTTVDHAVVNFTRTTAVTRWPWTSATQRVTWTKGTVTKRVDVWASKSASSANIAIAFREVGSSSLGSASSSNYSRSSEFSQRTLTVDGVATAVYALFLSPRYTA